MKPSSPQDPRVRRSSGTQADRRSATDRKLEQLGAGEIADPLAVGREEGGARRPPASRRVGNSSRRRTRISARRPRDHHRGVQPAVAGEPRAPDIQRSKRSPGIGSGNASRAAPGARAEPEATRRRSRRPSAPASDESRAGQRASATAPGWPARAHLPSRPVRPRRSRSARRRCRAGGSSGCVRGIGGAGDGSPPASRRAGDRRSTRLQHIGQRSRTVPPRRAACR